MKPNHPRLAAASLVLLALLACAGPSIQLQPQPASAEQPLVFELHDWDWNRGSFELELRVTNHGDRTAFVERGFLTLDDGSRSMAPTSRPQTCKVPPQRTRKIYLRYPAVDEGVAALTLRFAAGAVSLDDRQGEELVCAPLRMSVGDPPAAASPPR